jgi:hypothetical protein
MSPDTVSQEIVKNKVLELEEFLSIKDYEGKVVYTTTQEELEDVLVNILATGSYTKTFDLFKGKISLTYQSISEEDRMSGYKFMNKFTEDNKDKVSRIEYDSYMSKINIALQLVRVNINKVTTNISQGSLDDRMLLLAKTPEEQIRLYSKYLSIFANITSKAFMSEDILKNS